MAAPSLGNHKKLTGEASMLTSNVIFPTGYVALPARIFTFPMRNAALLASNLSFPIGNAAVPARRASFPMRMMNFLVSEGDLSGRA